MVNKSKLLIILTAISGMAFATVNASLDRNQVSLGQSFTLTIDDANGTPDLQPLNTDFEVLGTSNSSQTSIINGKTSSQSSYIVTLTAKTTGKLVIPPLNVGNDKTAALSVEVSQPSKSAQEAANKQLFVLAQLSDHTTYPGVPVVLSVKFFYAQPVSNLAMADLKLDNATLQPSGKNIQYTANENGRSYQVTEQKFLITPNQAGKLIIPAVKVGGSVAAGGNDIFGMFDNRPFNTQSQPQILEVKPLPKGFDTGSWLPAKELLLNESWSLTSTSVTAGEPITRTITLQALGVSGSSIPNFSFAAPAGVNVYPDKSQTQDNVTNDGVLGQRVFKIAYVPTKNGTVTFPALSVKWWNITSNREETATLPAKIITVSGANMVNSQPATATTTAITNSTASAPVVSQVAQIAKNPTNRLWIYLTFIFGFLWLVTLGIAIYLWRKASGIKASKSMALNNFADEEHKASVKLLLKSALAACDMQDSRLLATELTKWAAKNWDQPIHSLGEVCNLIPENPDLIEQIKLLNASLYGQNIFNNYALLKKLLTNADFSKFRKDFQALDELYPTKN